MSCTRALHVLGSHPQPAVMPVDLAKCLSLSRRQSLYQLLSSSSPHQISECAPKTGLHSPPLSSSSSSSSSPSPPPPSSAVPSGPRSCFRKDGSVSKKKRVVFADAVGLALTAVRLFIPDFSSSPSYSTLLMRPPLARLQGQQLTSSKPGLQTSDKQQRYKLRLGFPQPVLDWKTFITHLREKHVQLESCNVSEHSFAGKVCISHDSIEKIVHIRITFDSWRSHHEIPCTFLQQQTCGGTDMDVFTFDLNLPKNLDPNERVEFCVCFTPEPGATAHCDDNRGQNYRLCFDKDFSNANQDVANRFYPSLSQHRQPSWPSPASLSMQNSNKLQYLQEFIKKSQSREGTSVELSKSSEFRPLFISNKATALCK